jgi:uncharacterized membrane protein YkvA (DUF1232 family)
MKSNDLYPATSSDLRMNADPNQPKAKRSRGSINIFWMWLIVIIAVLYVISPIDFMPDLVPVIGWIDDVVIALTAISIALPKIAKRNH